MKKRIKAGLQVYRNMWHVMKYNAEREGKKPFEFLLRNIAKMVLYTIPGFAIVILFPIKPYETYGWLSGIWHGWFALCNMIISIFNPDTLYAAPLSTTGYEIGWWICCVYAIIFLFNMVLWPMIDYRDKRDIKFIAPIKQTDVHIDKTKPDTCSQDDPLKIKTSISQRVIKVFISSTFQDMQEERDYLMTHTFPQLQEIAAKRNVKFVPIDLRWGITEEESKSGKVLELCLQEIDNAVPFFIGIIGKRYGWCPPVEEFERSEFLKEKYPWIEQDFKQHLSVTEIEFQYGVLRRKERINALFFSTKTNTYLLSAVDSDDGRIDRLKKSIVDDGRYPLINAVSADQVGNRVLDIYTKFLDEYFPAEETIQAQDVQIPDNDYTNAESLIFDYLARFGKKLTKEQTAFILAHPLSNNKEILKTLLDELVTFGKFEELDEHIHFLLEAQTPNQFYQKMLECYEKQYNPREVRDFFSIMRLTGYGLKVKDALDIADVDQINMVIDPFEIITSPMSFLKSMGKGLTNIQKKPFDQYFKMYLKRDEDRISLSNEAMGKAIDERYLKDDKIVRKYRKKIIDDVNLYSNTYKDSDKNIGRLEEIAYQMLMLGQRNILRDFLNDELNNYVVRRYFMQHCPNLYNDFLKALEN